MFVSTKLHHFLQHFFSNKRAQKNSKINVLLEKRTRNKCASHALEAVRLGKKGKKAKRSRTLI